MASFVDHNLLMQRTRQYWYEDGFSDLGKGLYLLLVGFFLLIESIIPRDSVLMQVWSAGGVVVIIGAAVGVVQFVQELKTRLTYPRTGYVNYERKGLIGALRLIGIMLIGALAGATLASLYRSGLNLALLSGLLFAFVFGVLGYRLKLLRYLLLALWSLGAGLVLAPFISSVEEGLGLFLIAIGLGMLISGWVTWRRYTGRVPGPGAEE